MNQPDLIDSAIFDITCSAALNLDERASLDQFIKSDLLRIIDEVFDEIKRNAIDSDQVLRLERLEIDLGVATNRQYRHEFPQKLRRKLTLALGDVARPVRGHSQSTAALIDEKSASMSQLFYFLRHGYLPWYSRGMDAEKLEALLVDTLDTAPDSLVEFWLESGRRRSMLERLEQQFPKAIAERAILLLPDTRARSGGGDADTGDIERQLVSGLLAGDSAMIDDAWPVLFADRAGWLERAIRYHGQRQAARRRLVESLAAAHFHQLLALLEPGAHGFVQTVIAEAEIFVSETIAAAGGKTEYEAQLREHSLTYLLVERGNRFSEKHFLESLIRQAAATQDLSLPDLAGRLRQKLEAAKRPETGELARIIAEIDDRITTRSGASAANTSGEIEAYRQLERIRAGLRGDYAGYRASPLVSDVRSLAAGRPWLMLRLFRELQAERYDWRSALKILPDDLPGELVQAFLRLKNQAAATATDELAAAIRIKAPEVENTQAYYARILDCLVADEWIDFETILAADASVETGAVGPGSAAEAATDARDGDESDITARLNGLAAMDAAARHLLLQCAEMLTTASLGAGISLSVARLETLKWDFIRDYADATGDLFSEAHFARQYVDSLLREVSAGDRDGFSAALIRNLRRDSLPSTRAMSERLAEFLAGQKSVPDAGDGYGDSSDEPAVLEDIHIANAGAVLLAPFLPRLFDRLGLTEGDVFVDREAAERAVHCLQYLVDKSLSSPEFRLVLNKLLCGVRPGRPIRRGIDLASDDKQQLDSLLEAVIEHWGALGNTSPEGLRESFLQRGGRLQRRAEGWHLSVEGRSFDMLLGSIPWAYSTIRFAWMDRPIYVEWR